MSLDSIRFKNFTAFRDLHMSFSPGINVLIGANATGKTHLLKVAYAACDVSKTKQRFSEKLLKVFRPSKDKIGRMVYRKQGSSEGIVVVEGNGRKLTVSFTNHTEHWEKAKIVGQLRWQDTPVSSVYIPVKEMLANAPGFRSLVASREVNYSDVYVDILDRAYLPLLQGPLGADRTRLLNSLQGIMGGKVQVKDEEFFHNSRQGNLEFSLVAEGMRKLGLLWQLIQNGTLLGGVVLFWDEPEANLNPNVVSSLVKILLELHRLGVQIFLATHDYVLLKELDLQARDTDDVLFHSLYRDKKDGDDIHSVSTKSYLDIHPNTIADTFADLYDREIKRQFGAAK